MTSDTAPGTRGPAQPTHPRFGTDGVRGRAGTDLTPEFVLVLGSVAARIFAKGGEGAPTIVVGEDTRASSASLRSALASGIAAAGGNVIECGVIPTGGVALVTRELGAEAGAVISASHNPATDNGVKFFGSGGQKLPDAVEAEIQEELDRAMARGGAACAASTDMGEVRRDEGLVDVYVRLLLEASDVSLSGLRVVVDCANGAAYRVGPRILREAGAAVEVICDSPDGRNINAGCGATAPTALAERVRESKADVGLAFDGDADRLVAVDAHGAVRDGDDILAVCAVDLAARRRLRGDAVVATVMSNLGLRRCLAAHGIGVVTSSVGDRSVLIALEDHDLSLGGEQSGHVIFRDVAPTGDGILTALMLCGVITRGGRLADLTAEIERVPQSLVNVELVDRSVLERAGALWDLVRDIEVELGERGQVVVRPSGTEPKLRIMVQADTAASVDSAIERISQVATRLT
ncbi:MAG: phosphoglucosamine mutase [Acidimicrobiia bacterium]|nr:phosphoglucosamine mutase [Acidimicrobiia bacterium]